MKTSMPMTLAYSVRSDHRDKYRDQQGIRLILEYRNIDYLLFVGFCLTVPMRIEIWKGRGVLIDKADPIYPWHAGWSKIGYRPRLAKEIQDKVHT